MHNVHRNIVRTYRDKRGHNLYMVIRDVKTMTMELFFYPADGREPQQVTWVRWRIMNSGDDALLETKAVAKMAMLAQNLAKMEEEQASRFVRELQQGTAAIA